MPRVYVCNKGPHDFRPAQKFGELVFVTKGDVNKFAIGDIYRTFQSALKESTEDDFFLPTSLPILISIGTGILAHKHGIVRYLLFRAGRYVVYTVDFTDREYHGEG